MKKFSNLYTLNYQINKLSTYQIKSQIADDFKLDLDIKF